jgi:hypothetical protein
MHRIIPLIFALALLLPVGLSARPGPPRRRSPPRQPPPNP